MQQQPTIPSSSTSLPPQPQPHHPNSTTHTKSTLLLKNIESPSRLQVYPAYNGTYIAWDNSWTNRHIYHISNNGDIISQLTQISGYQIQKLIMMSSRVVVVCMTKKMDDEFYYLLEWNFEVKISSVFKFRCFGDGVGKGRVIRYVFGFPQTHIIYIVEISNSKQQNLLRIKITTLPFPLSNHDGKQLHKFEAQLPISAYSAMKFNNRSSLQWKKCENNENQVVFYVYDFHKEKDKFETYSIKFNDLPFKNLEDSSLYTLAISDIWEVEKDLLYLECKQILSPSKFKKTKSFGFQLINEHLAKQSTHHFLRYGHGSPFEQICEQDKSQFILQFLNGFRRVQRFTRNQSKKFNFTQMAFMMPAPKYEKSPFFYHNYLQNITTQKETLQICNHDYKNNNFKQCYPEYNISLYQSTTWKQVNCDVEVQVDMIRMNGFLWSVSTVVGFFMEEIVNGCEEDLMCYVAEMID